MAIIMRSSGQKRDQDNKRRIYTWVGCGLVTILTLVSVVPNMGSEPKAPDYSKFSSYRQQDLAAMPFGSDAEESDFLNNNPEYAGISNEELLGSLFSSEDKEERQARDESEGVPPPPDPEYKEIAIQKERIEENKRIDEERKQRRVADRERIAAARQKIVNQSRERNQNRAKNTTGPRSQKETTRPATFSPRGGISNRGGGGTSVGVTWAYQDKKIDAKNNSMPADHNITAKDMAFAEKYGRGAGLDVAAIKSAKAEKDEDLDKAAHDAISAFQDEVTPESLEDDKNELGLDGELPTIDPGLQDELRSAINDDINKQSSGNNNNKSSGTAGGKEYSINENCIDTNGQFVRSCVMGKLLNWGLTTAGNMFSSWASNGFQVGKSHDPITNNGEIWQWNRDTKQYVCSNCK